VPYGIMWKFGPRPTPCHPDLFCPRYQDWVPTIKDPIETQPWTFFEPWPTKRILLPSPEAKDSGISSRESE